MYAPPKKEDPDEGPANHKVYPEGKDSVTLYVSAKENEAKKAVLMALGTDKTLDPKVTANWTGAIAPGDTGLATVTFNCKEGNADATRVMLVLADRPSGVAARFAMYKKCAGVQTSQDTVKAIGVDVATKAGLGPATGERHRAISTPDVVENGSPTAAYVMGTDAKKDGLKPVAADVGFTTFFVALSSEARENGDKIELGPMSVIAEASTARPVVSGPLAEGGSLAKDSPASLPLTVTYNCRRTGKTPVSVRIPVTSPKGSITFSFMKECAVDDTNKTAIKRAVRAKASVPGLTVQTSNTYDPFTMVENGFTVPSFTESAGGDPGAPGRNMISAGRKAFSFAAFMSGENTEAVAVDAPIVFVEDAEVASARIDEDITQVTAEKTEMKLKFRCFKTGSTKVSVTIPLNPPTGEVKFTIVKVCDPDQSLIEENRAAENADAGAKPTMALDIATSAKGDPVIVRNGNVQDDFVARKLATRYAPPVDDVLKATRAPALKLSEGCLGCLPATDSLGMTAATVQSKLVKCNVTAACSFEEYNAARKAFRKVVSGAYGDAAGPAVIAPGAFSMDAFLRASSGALQIGNAEVVSFDEKVCVPKLVGPGALASTLNPDGSNKAKRLTVTFNCVGYGGTALVMVTVPVYGRKSGTVSFSVLKQCAAVNATEFGGEESDNAEMANELENVIAHAGAGLHVGRAASGDGAKDVVDNGLVLPEFLPTSSVEDRDAGGYQVTEDKNSFTFYLSSAEGPDAEAISVGIPQVISFNPRIAKTTVSETSDLHRSQASRRKFQLNEPLEMTVNFDCLSEGIAVIAVAVPLGPRGGGIHFEFTKACPADEGFKPFTGEVIKGLAVGTAEGEADVIKDGQTARLWTRYKKSVGPGGRKMVDAGTQTVDFYLKYDGDKPMNFGAPLVVAHKPTCNPRIEGAAAEGGALTKSTTKLSIRFNCVWDGQTAVTVFVPLPGHKDNGHVVFTMTKRCTTMASDVKGSDFEIPLDELRLVDADGDGVVGPLHEDWMPWNADADYGDYYGAYRGYYAAYDNYYAYDYAPWTNDWQPDEWADKKSDEYWWYGDQTSYYGSYDSYNEGDMIDPWSYELEGYGDEYEDMGDALVDEIEARGWDNTNALSVGTHVGSMDIVKDGVPMPRFKLCEPTPGQPCDLMSLMGKDATSFVVTASSGSEILRRPQAFAKYPRSVVAEITNADAIDGKVVTPEEPVEVHVSFTCLKQGVTSPVLITLPYGPFHVDFALVKVCGKRYSAATVAIEATTVFVGIGIVASMLLSFLAGSKLKKLRDGRDLNA
mmetsp:Transcript_6053/g.24045  ORF Transcript_6053/g.24045 Transcript_6053/m.24045 type:complete len:1290 (-) Transcript_6053:220-4089(-)|eukprot:PRCOL_00002018-RA